MKQIGHELLPKGGLIANRSIALIVQPPEMESVPMLKKLLEFAAMAYSSGVPVITAYYDHSDLRPVSPAEASEKRQLIEVLAHFRRVSEYEIRIPVERSAASYYTRGAHLYRKQRRLETLEFKKADLNKGKFEPSFIGINELVLAAFEEQRKIDLESHRGLVRGHYTRDFLLAAGAKVEHCLRGYVKYVQDKYELEELAVGAQKELKLVFFPMISSMERQTGISAKVEAFKKGGHGRHKIEKNLVTYHNHEEFAEKYLGYTKKKR